MSLIDYITARLAKMYAWRWRSRRAKITQAEHHADNDDPFHDDLAAIRLTARHRLTINGSDAQVLEHALTAVEVERDMLTEELDYYYRKPTERTTVARTTPPKDYAHDLRHGGSEHG